MAKIEKASLPHVFSAFAINSNAKAFDYAKSYLCDLCNQSFKADWCMNANPFFPWILRGSYVICPYCGQRHHKQICYTKKNDYVPYKMKLKLTTYKNKIVFQMNYFAFCFLNKDFTYDTYCAKELFVFDINKKQSHFEKYIEKNTEEINFTKIEITDDNATEILKNSALSFLNQASYAYKNESVMHIFRSLRANIESMLKDKCKRKIPSLYVNTRGLADGILVKAIISFARRIKDITAPNHSRSTTFPSSTPLKFFSLSDKFSRKELHHIYNSIINGIDEITSVIQQFALPNAAAVRKIIQEESEEAIPLKHFFQIFQNYDLALRAYHTSKSMCYMNIKDVSISLKRLHAVYEEKALVTLLEDKSHRYDARDILSLVRRLNDTFFDLLLVRKVRIRDLHDWLVKQYNQQVEIEMQDKNKEIIATHINKKLKVPADIIENFTRTIDGFSFTIPTESIDLLIAGQALRNCIGTYDRRMLNKSCYVVLVKNEAGNILAGIEVVESRIVQAEISHHTPLYKNKELNQAVIEWSKRTSLCISTQKIAAA